MLSDGKIFFRTRWDYWKISCTEKQDKSSLTPWGSGDFVGFGFWNGVLSMWLPTLSETKTPAFALWSYKQRPSFDWLQDSFTVWIPCDPWSCQGFLKLISRTVLRFGHLGLFLNEFAHLEKEFYFGWKKYSYIYRWERGGNVIATHFGTLLTLLSSWHFLSSAGVLDNGELNTHLPVATHVQLYQALSIGCTRTIQEHISEQQSYFYKILFLFFLDGRADRRKKTSLLASKETSSWKQFISNRRSRTAMLGFSHPHVMCPEPLETRKEYHIWLAGTTR